MAKKKQIDPETRSAILTLVLSGMPYRKVARNLHVSYNGVLTTVERFGKTNSLADRKRSGRPKCTKKTDDERIQVLAKSDRKLTGPQIRAQVNAASGLAISDSTVKRRLREKGLYGRIAVRKPLLSKKNRLKRLAWARKYKSYTSKNWANVLWSDESKFQIFGSSRRVYVRRSQREKMLPACIIPTVKHGGGSVMVWGCFSRAGVGDLVKIEGIMKKEQYLDILKNNAVPSGSRLIGKKIVLQQDNDPKHTAKICKMFVEQQEQEGTLKNMEWPPQSPDLNPIELLWEELDRKVRQQCPTSQTTLWAILQDSWQSISDETIEKLIDRMPRLCTAVIKAKGGFFDEKYA